MFVGPHCEGQLSHTMYLDHIVKIVCITQCICDIANTYCISVLLCATTSASGLMSLNRHLGGQNIISLSHFYFNKTIESIQSISIKICDKKLASFNTLSISFSKIVYLLSQKYISFLTYSGSL